jgi:PBSX family phage terminase large subunit
MLEKSTPNFEEFDPRIIPFQKNVMYDINKRLNFNLGTHELLWSGSIGSAKSLLAAHVVVMHCLTNKGAKVLIGRRSLPDLKDTLFQKIIEHLEHDRFLDGRDYTINYTSAYIEFSNGSMIIGKSWADKKYKKFRSLELSMAVIEEAVENEGDDYKALIEIRQRVGRQPHIKKNMIIYCTNPAGPSHELYKYFFDEKSETRHVYFSLTEQNPFLPRTYIEQLKKDLPPKEAERMLYGKWIEVDRERLYYAYNADINFKKESYNINPNLPISISFDFNIGHGKPMSAIMSQYDKSKDTFHFFDEVVMHGSRTEDILEEFSARGIFDMPYLFEIHGDATGGSRTTNSKWSNYDLIDQFLKLYKSKKNIQLKVNHRLLIPSSNPPIRERHNILNAYCKNANGDVRLFVYEKCKVAHEGMKLTALKKGAAFIEDDSKEYQHVTTAIGYRVVYTSQNKVIVKGGNF